MIWQQGCNPVGEHGPLDGAGGAPVVVVRVGLGLLHLKAHTACS